MKPELLDLLRIIWTLYWMSWFLIGFSISNGNFPIEKPTVFNLTVIGIFAPVFAGFHIGAYVYRLYRMIFRWINTPF